MFETFQTCLGTVLLLVAVLLEVVAIPLNIARDSTPISNKIVRTREQNFAPAEQFGFTYRGEYLNVPGLPRVHYLDLGNTKSNETIGKERL